MSRLLNQDFGDSIGVHFTMASRIRSGQRLPSLKVCERISEVYKIPLKTLLDARRLGKAEFSALIRKRVFKEDQVAA